MCVKLKYILYFFHSSEVNALDNVYSLQEILISFFSSLNLFGRVITSPLLSYVIGSADLTVLRLFYFLLGKRVFLLYCRDCVTSEVFILIFSLKIRIMGLEAIAF